MPGRHAVPAASSLQPGEPGNPQRRRALLGSAWNATIAVLVAAALLLQLWIAAKVASTPPAHAVGTLAGAALPSRIVRVFSFFTIQSNILAGLICATLAVAPTHDGRLWRALRVAGLFGITVTGIVYSTVLAKYHEPHGWQETTCNAVFHFAVPLMVVLGWLAFGPRPRIGRDTVALGMTWPIAWVGYTLLHGAVSHWYPYPFLDVTSHGYARVAVNSGAVLVVLLLVTALYGFGDRRLPSR